MVLCTEKRKATMFKLKTAAKLLGNTNSSCHCKAELISSWLTGIVKRADGRKCTTAGTTEYSQQQEMYVSQFN